MITLILSLLLSDPERQFADTLRSMTEHTKCEVRQVLKDAPDASRIVSFVCPDARLAVIFERTPEGKWKPIDRVYSGPLVWPEGMGI